MTDLREYALNLQKRCADAGVSVKLVFVRAGRNPNVILHWLNGKGGRESSKAQIETVMQEYEALAAKYPAIFNQPKEEQNGTTQKS